MQRAKTPQNSSPARRVRSARTKAGPGPKLVSLDEEIRLRAYEIYQQRGYAPGDETEDWLIAEREVRARHNLQQSA
jgi:hypothetical protein